MEKSVVLNRFGSGGQCGSGLAATRNDSFSRRYNMEEIIEVVEEISLGEVELILIEIEKHGGHRGRRHPHLVCVTVDGEEKQVRAGRYRVAVFKKAVGVDPTYELEELEGGKLVPLADDAHIRIRGGESFISHVRGGVSS
jgi:uncharacterized protein YceH (UPF0502 family)